MLRSCSHFPQRCELPAECQPRSSSWGGATWSEGDSPLPLRSREGSSLLPQVVPWQARVLPLHAQRGAGHKSLQHHRYLRWRKCQYTFFSPSPFLLSILRANERSSRAKLLVEDDSLSESKISIAPSLSRYLSLSNEIYQRIYIYLYTWKRLHRFFCFLFKVNLTKNVQVSRSILFVFLVHNSSILPDFFGRSSIWKL